MSMAIGALATALTMSMIVLMAGRLGYLAAGVAALGGRVGEETHEGLDRGVEEAGFQLHEARVQRGIGTGRDRELQPGLDGRAETAVVEEPDRGRRRLLRRGQARYDETQLVHEFAQLDGPAGYLTQHLLHLNIEHMDELWRKQTSYAIQEAQTLYQSGRRARWRNFVGAPLREFRRRYISLGGYRDGAVGLLLCATLAYFEWVKFAHLKGLERT